MTTTPIPNGYHTATPYLIVESADLAIDFYKKAFGAIELIRLTDPSGKVAHAEVKIGNSPIMLADEFPEMGFRSPQAIGGSSVSIMLYVQNVDLQFSQAAAAGAKILRPVEDQFFGDRSGTLEDPFGHVWTIATHKEDVSDEEINRRFETYWKQQSGT